MNSSRKLPTLNIIDIGYNAQGVFPVQVQTRPAITPNGSGLSLKFVTAER